MQRGLILVGPVAAPVDVAAAGAVHVAGGLVPVAAVLVVAAAGVVGVARGDNDNGAVLHRTGAVGRGGSVVVATPGDGSQGDRDSQDGVSHGLILHRSGLQHYTHVTRGRMIIVAGALTVTQAWVKSRSVRRRSCI